MIRIGEFARRGGVSVKTVRHYADLGLLPPADVDERTGYRRFRTDQLVRLTRIRRLREVGFGVEEILAILDDPMSLRRHLETRREELRRETRRTRDRLARVERWLAAERAERAISVRTAAPTHVAGVRARLERYEEIERLFLRAEARLPRAASVSGRIAAWWSGSPGREGIDAEALLVVAPDCPGARRLEPGLVATTTYEGEAWEPSYAALAGWMARCGRTIAGPKLERYLDGDRVEMLFPLDAAPGDATP